jgi:hypothetical protein
MKIKVLDNTLSTLLAHRLIFPYPAEKVWNPNGISLARRLKEDKPLKKRVDDALDPKNLKKYVVPVDSAAPTRCIDGRMTLGWEAFTDEQKCFLGPKIAGGTPHAALAARIVESMDITENLRFEDDIKYVVERYKDIGIGFGGHADTHAKGWNTGCGAVDNINLILEKMQRPEPQEQLRGLAQVILGDAYDGRFIVNEVIGRMLFLDALKPSYMPKENHDASREFLYKKTVVQLLRKEARTKAEVVPQLAGSHGEVALVLNSVKGTTFDTDRFSFDRGGDVQVFGWDLWEMYEEASRLYPYSMHDIWHNQKEAIAKRLKHITTRTLLGISTAMVLTDGSLKVVTVTGKSKNRIS